MSCQAKPMSPPLFWQPHLLAPPDNDLLSGVDCLPLNYCGRTVWERRVWVRELWARDSV